MRNYNTKISNSWIKSKIKPKDIPKEKYIEVCNSNLTMSMACAELGLHFGTFIKYAKLYGCYKPNQSGKGTIKNISSRKWSLEKWNNNENFNTQRSVVKKWILKFNLIPYKCNKCGIKEWNKEKITLELNHINGNNWQHNRTNLELLCPNCHSQTNTFRGKNKN